MGEQLLKVNNKVGIGNLYKTDLHMHTIYCDGKNTPEEMVLSAIEKGMDCIGFSGHSYVEFDKECGMNEKNAALYFAEISGLKEKYKDRIRIYCGVEQDDCSETATDGYDYVIGSVHYIRISKKLFKEKFHCACLAERARYLPGISDTDIKDAVMQDEKYYYGSVDDTPEKLAVCARVLFDNDFYAVAENYYEALSHVPERTGADITGHFDLISKFNEKYRLFDEKHPRYEAAWKRAADILLSKDMIFEINTGGMSRGWKSSPYPASCMIDYLKNKGARFIFSSDSHDVRSIGYGFDLLAVQEKL